MDSQTFGRIKVQILLSFEEVFTLQDAFDKLTDFSPTDVKEVIMSLSKPNGVLKKVGDKFLPPNFGDEDRKEKDPIRVSIKGKRRPKKT